MFFTCLQIFFARIVDVSLGTVRTVLIIKGNKLIASVIAFFEVLIWFIVAREALNTSLNSILIPIFYSAGYATGTYLGSFLTRNFLKGIICLEVITNAETSARLIKEIQKAGFGVSIIKLENKNKKLLKIELSQNKLKVLTKIIRSHDKDAFVIVSETKYVQNGIIK